MINGIRITFDTILDAITALRTKNDISLNISAIPRTNSFINKRNNSKDSLFITHESINNKDNTTKHSSPQGGKMAPSPAFALSRGDQDPPKEESADFGGRLEHPDPDYNSVDQKENKLMTKTSYTTALSPLEKTHATVFEGNQYKPSIPHIRLSNVKGYQSNQKPATSPITRTPSSANPGLLIDCGKQAVKKFIQSPLQAIQMLPDTVNPDNIKGLKLDGHYLTELVGLPKNLVVLNISNCQISSLELIGRTCPNIRLLNIGYNNLSTLKGLFDLQYLSELYINNNNFATLEDCRSIAKLRILDASANPLNNIENIEFLSDCPLLKYVQIKDTLVSTPDVLNDLKQLMPTVQFIENEESVSQFSTYAKISAFAFGTIDNFKLNIKAVSDTYSSNDRIRHTPQRSNTDDESLGRTNDSRLSKKLSQKKDISNIIEQVSSKECTIVSQRNITDSISKSNAFNNPIAAMMIAPPQGIQLRAKSQKKVFKRMTPTSQPTSTKHTGLKYYAAFGTAKKQQTQLSAFSAKNRPVSAKYSEPTVKNYRPSHGAIIQQQNVPTKLRVVRKITPSKNRTENQNIKILRPSEFKQNSQAQPNLRDLLKEVYQVIKKNKQEDNKVKVDTLVVVNTTPHIMQNGINSKGDMGSQKKNAAPICIDLRSERKFYLKERITNS